MVLNRDTDKVLEVSARPQVQDHKEISVTTAGVTDVVDPKYQHAVDENVDEVLQEETGVHNESQVTATIC